MNDFKELMTNPFAVKTPDSLSAEDLVKLFVPYSEYIHLQISGHQFLNGHRGSGKSMMLHMMTPEAQCLSLQCSSLEGLSYYGAYLSIKATEVNLPEYVRLEDEPSGYILSEHVLVTKLLSALFVSLRSDFKCKRIKVEESMFFKFLKLLKKRLGYVGWTDDGDGRDIPVSGIDFWNYIVEIFDEIQSETVRYVKKRSFDKDFQPYNGALLGYQDVLLPVVKALRDYCILPPKPVYFLLDDADNLTLQQTKILNTWVSYRSTDIVSLKISTQMGYKTYKTSSDISIESPHDYSVINFTSVNTGSKDTYSSFVEDIVKKRLEYVGITNISPRDFFPEDMEQKRKIDEISERFKAEWSDTGKGYRPGDDSYRYARPEYIRLLSGSSKQGSNYRYAGFDQLVHISSGIVRYFLEPAAKMYADQEKHNLDKPVVQIDPAIQDSEIRKQSDSLLIDRFDDMRSDAAINTSSDIEKLKNMINGLGSIFQAHIMDESLAQRRIFAFTISDNTPPIELEKLLKLGLSLGYLYEGKIGKKDGFGRDRLFVLTRRLAPAFKLDPVGFSGRISLQSKLLLDMAEDPKRFVSRIRKNGVASTLEDGNQLSLLED